MYQFDEIELITNDGYIEVHPKSLTQENIKGLFPKDFELLQYTGLKDKNGKGRWSKEIYEGDIIEDKRGERFVVKYQQEWGAFIADQGDSGELFFLSQNKKWSGDDKLSASGIKVIGNVFENPELLEEKNA